MTRTHLHTQTIYKNYNEVLDVNDKQSHSVLHSIQRAIVCIVSNKSNYEKDADPQMVQTTIEVFNRLIILSQDQGTNIYSDYSYAASEVFMSLFSKDDTGSLDLVRGNTSDLLIKSAFEEITDLIALGEHISNSIFYCEEALDDLCDKTGLKKRISVHDLNRQEKGLI